MGEPEILLGFRFGIGIVGCIEVDLVHSHRRAESSAMEDSGWRNGQERAASTPALNLRNLRYRSSRLSAKASYLLPDLLFPQSEAPGPRNHCMPVSPRKEHTVGRCSFTVDDVLLVRRCTLPENVILPDMEGLRRPCALHVPRSSF